MTPVAFVLAFFTLRAAAASYFPSIVYSGASFFDGFDFYGNFDNTTWGNVTYVDAADANTDQLAYVNAAGNAIIRVDNTTVVPDVPFHGPVLEYRKSVRLQSKATFDVGTLIVIDALHIPYGCSVWPAIWMNGVLEAGQVWPDAGEIDIVEAINLMDHNQMALHTTAGCVQSPDVQQLGQTIITNCNETTKSGCTVAEKKPNSYGEGFATANGGAFALQFDTDGINMWFWPREDIPASITTPPASSSVAIDMTDWGVPSAAYPASGCDITEFFPAQWLVIDITLCGEWAGVQSIYDAGCEGTCFDSNIVGNGSNYNNAFFEIPSIRTWSTDPAAVLSAYPTAASSTGASAAPATTGGSADAASTSPSTKTGAARKRTQVLQAGNTLGAGVVAGVLVGVGIVMGML